MNRCRHLKARKYRLKRPPCILKPERLRDRKGRAHEETPSLGITKLGAVGDVAAIFGEAARYGRDNAGAIRTGECEHKAWRGCGHVNRQPLPIETQEDAAIDRQLLTEPGMHPPDHDAEHNCTV
jgi:hypothetical protein